MSNAWDDDGEVLVWAEDHRPDWLYEPGPTIAKFHDDRSSLRRLVRAPNQVGKTYAGAWESNRASLEMPGSVGCVMLADLENMYPEVSAKIWAVIARDELHPDTKYVDGKGFFTNGRRGIRYKNGSRWIFRSGKGEVMSVESYTAHWGWFDEVPMRTHFGGFLRGVATHNGPIWGTLTPIGRPVEWFRERVEGDPETGEPPDEHWEQFVPELSTRECWWRTQESIDTAIAAMDPWERPQRSKGAWEGPTGERRFNGYTDVSVIAALPGGLEREWYVGVFMDHGEHVGSECALLVIWDDANIIAWDEYVNATATTPRADAQGISDMLVRRSLGIGHVDEWKGDVNTAGKSAEEGRSINEELERAFAELLNLDPDTDRPVRISKPSKGKGSVGKGERLLNHALMRHELLVHERCKVLRKSLTHYRGKEDPDLKHPIDALRYGVVPVLMDKRRPSYSQLFVGR